MASFSKRTWKTKKGEIKTAWEFSYYKDGVRYRKTFKKKPTVDEMNEVTKTTSKNPYFKETLQNYIDELSLHCKESTIETYKNYKKVALEPLYQYKIKSLSRDVMVEFLKKFKENKAPKTYNNILTFLKGFFEFCIEKKYISQSPLKKIKGIPIPETQASAMDEVITNCFIKYAKKQPFWVYAFFMIMLYMGLRISECIALNRADIDLLHKKMNIDKQYYRYRLTSTKNYATRILDIPDILLEILNELLNITKALNSPLLFNSPDEPGKYASVNNLRERYFENIKRAMEDELNMDLTKLTPHSLRHTHASYLLSRGVQVKYVSERLGHKTAKTTLNVYNHALPSDNTKAMELLNNINRRKKDAEMIG